MTSPALVPAVARLNALAQSPVCLFLHWNAADLPPHDPATGSATPLIRLTDVASGAQIDAPLEAAGAERQYVYVDAAGRTIRAQLGVPMGDGFVVLAESGPLTMPRLGAAGSASGTVWMRLVDGHAAGQTLAPADANGWEPVTRPGELPTAPPAEWLGDRAEERLTRRLLDRWPTAEWETTVDANDAMIWRSKVHGAVRSRTEGRLVNWTLEGSEGDDDESATREVIIRYAGSRMLRRNPAGQSLVSYGPWHLTVRRPNADATTYVVEREWSVSLAWQSPEPAARAQAGKAPPPGDERTRRRAANQQAEEDRDDAPHPDEWLDPRRDIPDAAHPPADPFAVATTLEQRLTGASEHLAGGPGQWVAGSSEQMLRIAGTSTDFPLLPPGAQLLRFEQSGADATGVTATEPTPGQSGQAGSPPAALPAPEPFVGKGPADWLDEAGGGHDNRDLHPNVAAAAPRSPAPPAAPPVIVVAQPIAAKPLRPTLSPDAAQKERTIVRVLAGSTIGVSVIASLLIRAVPWLAVLLELCAIVLLTFTIRRRRRTGVVPADDLFTTLATMAVGIALALVLTLAVAGLEGPVGILFIGLILFAEWALIRPLVDPPDKPDLTV